MMSDPNDAGLDALLEEVAAVDVPEPSPLFWDHFSARVNAAIDAPQPAPRWWRLPAVVAWTAAAAVVVLSIVSVYRTGTTNVATPDPSPHREVADAGDAVGVPDAPDVEADEAWAVVRSFAADLHYEDAHDVGVVPGPGAIERAATELPDDERAELLRLIQDEMKRRGA